MVYIRRRRAGRLRIVLFASFAGDARISGELKRFSIVGVWRYVIRPMFYGSFIITTFALYSLILVIEGSRIFSTYVSVGLVAGMFFHRGEALGVPSQASIAP